MNIQRMMFAKYTPCQLIHRVVFCTHNETCPQYLKQFDKKGSGFLKRADKPGKVRFGFIPEEFFLFFYSKTGVTGPYLFGIMLTNYLVSKEIYVMEHEYYIGLSIFVIVCYGTKKLGKMVGAALDKEIEIVEAGYNSIRKREESHYETIIKTAEEAQWRAHGQKLLVEAKKENIAMQLEACYRERLQQVYKTVKQRLDYRVRLYSIQNGIHQKWMCAWILENVLNSITPEIEKSIIDRAIEDIAELAGQSKNK